jgi:ankyrin repeat protein
MLRRLAIIFLALIASDAAHAGALFDAAKKGDLAAVEKLLAEGADVDERGRNAETPLMAAALAGKVAVAELLIARGADVMARNAGGFTPLHAATYSGSKEVVRLLLDNGAVLDDAANSAGVTPLLVAAEENDLAIVELLIAEGAELNVRERHGYTPLSRATFKGHTGVMALLKRHGATCQGPEIMGERNYRTCEASGS